MHCNQVCRFSTTDLWLSVDIGWHPETLMTSIRQVMIVRWEMMEGANVVFVGPGFQRIVLWSGHSYFWPTSLRNVSSWS